MSNPDMEVIKTDGQDTMPSMAQKINQNFQSIINFVNATFERVAVSRVVATEGQELVATPKFARNAHSLIVYLNGAIQVQNEHYVEASDRSIRFLNPLSEKDEVYTLSLSERLRNIESVEVDSSLTQYLIPACSGTVGARLKELKEIIPCKVDNEGQDLVFRGLLGDKEVELFRVASPVPVFSVDENDYLVISGLG